MPAWLSRVVFRVRELVSTGSVVFTRKAILELEALDVGIDQEDALEILGQLSSEDFSHRAATHLTGEWMYVFRPAIAGVRLYVKLILRRDCVVVSFHEETKNHEDEEQT